MHGRTPTRLSALLFAGALSTLALSACKQGEGERCQIDDDCQTNYYCEYGGNTKTIGGYCKSTTATVVDLSTKPVDMAQKPVDMTTVVDMAGTD